MRASAETRFRTMRKRSGQARTSGRLVRLWSQLWKSALPTLGCEIAPASISVARWCAGSRELETAAWEPLPPGAVEASPLRDNIRQPEEVRRVLGEILGSLGIPTSMRSSARPLDAVLVIPDQAAKLFVLNFEAFPERASEALPVLKWRLKKSVPFEIESAAIAYFAQRLGAQWQVVVIATPQFIIQQYEDVVQSFRLRPRRIVLSTLASLGLASDLRAPDTNPAQTTQEGNPVGSSSSSPPGVLTAKYSPPWLTVSILQKDYLRLFRTVGLAATADGLLMPAQVLEALYPSFAYFQDNFEGSLERAYLCGLGENSAEIAESLEQELNLPAEPLVSDWSHSAPAGLEPYLAERYFAALLGTIRE